MTRYLLSRLGQSIIVLWGAFTASFVLLYALPSDSISIKLSGASDTGSITPAQMAQIRADYGLDRPLLVQYLDQLGDLLRGDFGTSLHTGATVTSTLASALPQTLVLSGLAIVVGTAVGLLLGSVSGYLPARARELLLSLPPIGVSIPTFTVGLVLIHVVAFQWRLLPSAGNQGFDSLVLPSLTLSLPVAAVVTQIFAKSLQGVLRQDYIATAVAKGAGRGRIHARHAFRNAIGPTLTMTGVITGNLLAGTVVVETIFSREGIGRTTVDAVNRQDLPIVQGVVLLSALTFIVVNLVVDLVYPVIDRRIALVTTRRATPFEREVLV